MNQFWEVLVRWRTWLVNTFGALLMLLPEVLNAPEVLAVIPTSYHKWVFVSVMLLNILMRPRPASIATDADVQVRKAIKRSAEPAMVTVTGAHSGDTKAVISPVKP